MLLAIISAAVCLAVATMMYTPRMRSFQFYRPIALIFLFEGIWVMLDYIFRQTMPDNVFMQIVHYIGLIIFGLYFAFKLFSTTKRKSRIKKDLNKE